MKEETRKELEDIIEKMTVMIIENEVDEASGMKIMDAIDSIHEVTLIK